MKPATLIVMVAFVGAMGCGGLEDEQSICAELLQWTTTAQNPATQPRASVEERGTNELTCPATADGVGQRKQAAYVSLRTFLGVGPGSHCICYADGFFMCTQYLCVCENSDGSDSVFCAG